MADQEVWNIIHAERAALAADLEALTNEQWQQPSLCADWTVRDTLAHMTSTAKITLGSFASKMVTSGFSLSKFQDKDIAAERGASTADTLARFRAVVQSTKSPPGPLTSWLGEAIIHAEDIRRPLAIAHQYPTDAVVKVSEFYKGSNLIIGAKKRIAGLHLKATDAGWSTGAGPEVSGPVLSLLLAMTGRKVALADLTGDGVSTLAERN